MQDRYTELLQQAQELVKDEKFAETPCARYVEYLADLRKDGKPFNEKETAFLSQFVAKPDEGFVCPSPPSKWRYAGAILILCAPFAWAIAKNAQPYRAAKAA